MNVDQYIADVVHKKPHASKKWLMAVIGISCVMFTFIITALICLLRPDVVQQLNVLSGQVITFLGALVGAYTTGQRTAMDDYIQKCIDGGNNIGVPVNYFLKPITQGMIARSWLAKYYPSKYNQAGSSDDSKDTGGNGGTGGNGDNSGSGGTGGNS